MNIEDLPEEIKTDLAEYVMKSRPSPATPATQTEREI